jgi:hypothetical protein
MLFNFIVFNAVHNPPRALKFLLSRFPLQCRDKAGSEEEQHRFGSCIDYNTS